MKEAALVIIKPDGISKKIIGDIIIKFAKSDLRIIASKVVKPDKKKVEEHYSNIKGTPFFNGVISYFSGDFHKDKTVFALIYCGKDAIRKCRKIAGATNPEEADPKSIRGSFGKITTKGIFENVVHVSSTKKESRREIKLWFEPGEIVINLYPSKIVGRGLLKKRVWI